MSTTLSNEEMILKVYGDLPEKERALLAVQQAIEVMYPKLTPDWEEEGYAEEDTDEAGYLTDLEWDSETIEHVARALFRHGFGPPHLVKIELGYAMNADDDDADEVEA